MIEELSIRSLGVIDEARLRWGPGLTVLTGETGAGKTMVLTALGLLLGDRADPSLVRGDAERLEVEAVVADPPEAVRQRVVEAGGTVEDVLLLARTVSSSRSRAFVGGRTVPAALLDEIGRALVAVHGQDAQQHLRRASAQRQALDRFAGPDHEQRIAEHRRAWEERERLATELAGLDAGARARAERRERLLRGLSAVDELAPESGEAARLRVALLRAEHGQALRDGVEGARRALSGDEHATGSQSPGAVGELSAAAKALARCAEDDSTAAELADRTRELLHSASVLVQDVDHYASGLHDDPHALEATHERRAALTAARRRWVDTDELWDVDVDDDADALRAWAEQARKETEAGDDATQRERMGQRLNALDTDLDRLRREIGQGRRKAAAALARSVGRELSALAMDGMTFVVEVADHPPGPTGGDSVAFLLSSASGARVPVDRAASGGERSRVMLALEVVLAASDPVPTFVFDEVDAGIGGSTALAVGERLARLARTAQVLVVTHLPQVAAFADHHLVVTKGTGGGVTTSDVREVVDDERAAELSRMLAGMSGSALGRAHAQELLDEARGRRDRS
jgi:DNA repair protein RecN (Recombination protein N)